MQRGHEVGLDRTEASMCRWMYCFKVKERKRLQSTENCWDWNQSVWLSRMVDLDGLGHVECKDDGSWVIYCVMISYGNRQSSHLRKIWWDYVFCKGGYERCGPVPRGCTDWE